ncbi:transferase family protein [Aspergillus clavatus NRRL 1]|uniref:Transferase family protein n=1 Tax=Aspergillus clavatus (strain ATCC 1007 / CBS 513.65 / DSM 816 / NCTC 3887 / NRRL 1 / QM 1276 / 107) TaxID=344612 RepID=A1CCD5_ASPCL|nr:transferase family protein [Aspergillus clavatus NRRL 1]EAW12192.1 transferase family protein [Aspergillus clavatus NRRL 1]
MRIQPSSTLIHEIPMLDTKHHPQHILPNTPQQIATDPNPDQSFAPLDNSYVPPVSLLPLAPGPRPVVRFQTNVLKDGIVLALGFHHAVFDATGAGLLIEMLADSCRGDHFPAQAPNIEHEEEIRLKRSVDEIGILANESDRADKVQDPNGSKTESAAQAPMGDSTWVPPKLSVYSFNLSAASLAHLKTACNKLLPVVLKAQNSALEDANEEKLSQEFVSTNDVLTALLATSISQARSRVAGTELVPAESKLAIAVNLRERASALPPNYLGNSLTVAEAFVHSLAAEDGFNGVSEKQHHPDIGNAFLLEIARVALQLRKSLAAIDDAYFREFVSRLWAGKNWSQVGANLPDTMVSSWRRLKVYRLDFGARLGCVVEFQPQVILLDGTCVIQPERVAHERDLAATVPEAGWEVYVTLQSDAMERFLHDGLFTSLSQGAIRRA